MSFDDIKDSWTDIKINGQVYKLAYDFNSIIKLEELLGKKHFEIKEVVAYIETQPAQVIWDFCYTAFLKYQPDFDKNELLNIDYIELVLIKCIGQYLRSVSTPDVYEQFVFSNKTADEASEKKKSPLKFLFGTILQKK